MSTVLVVGLGNPGASYAGTRHNFGFEVIAELSAQLGAGAFKANRKVNAEVAEARLGSDRQHVVLARPRCLMNLSGGPVRVLADYYKVPADHIYVCHDELELDLGQVALRPGGGDRGHNGLRSITKALGTKDYVRVSCGIGRPPGRMDPAAFVLRRFAKSERVEVAIAADTAAREIIRAISAAS
ncbi:aminoacyl-tRNA hydrolase [Corynebacterium uberis]|uniref:aminoacyl-tRNA hydrolase n=1 Tax=Corynebacterium TaxID=1716 RepID=UPI001D0AFABD|nr:aminoacyl-tRNA hydrolase [Corynebacterium uberis]MCZ9308837.1 aminoacyl-tRNA hydrolase [Corynebacterium sp. c6VSa_13]UDL72637.1 aminoacyl-tRNA hydrolase [Corynebacterium uberis]UDL76487.1 aminoacyl-tRNA hydrolase [Corynebacterium uberis]UDL78699.1 aminoacyl-tRNA hydrolase [Corynebacterium uberis]UDL80978.1 aminoacyl-tRNA hydrolase [Corynebacterium uberis]